MSTTAPTLDHLHEPPGRAPGGGEERSKAYYVLLIIALAWPTVVLSMSGLLLGNAQVLIAQHFHTTQIAWFTLITTLVSTMSVPFLIKASDMFGKKRVMIVASVVGVIGETLCALAPTWGLMLSARFLVGIYAVVTALTYSIVRDVFPAKWVGTATGVVATSTGLTALAGPWLSGWLQDNHGFRGVLWFLALNSFVALVLLLLVVPESPLRAPRTSFDWLGGLLLGGSATALVYGIGKGADWGWSDTWTLAYLIGGVAAFALFLVVEHRVAHPLLDVRLLRERRLLLILVSGGMASGVLFSTGTINQLLALYPKIPGMSDGLGYTATENAALGVHSSILLLLCGAAVGLIANRWGAKITLIAGLVSAIAGVLLMYGHHYEKWQFIAFGPFFAVGMGLVLASSSILIVSAVHPEDQATANGVGTLLGGVLGAISTQVIFSLLNDRANILQGTALYTDGGYKAAFLAGAAMLAVALVVAVMIPKVRTTVEAAAEAPADRS
ncbi:MFS transporter [Yinghuangia seranimata]|uniref:MFS transporter n=1 Tax=Yinghuangia seranimata TaxID=408067 RepID=UPI00248C8428|nr:MFS transporter [Yinghuangia seranimata]MDI2129386.1 MFS transporter [Yinghuangia seranimata]